MLRKSFARKRLISWTPSAFFVLCGLIIAAGFEPCDFEDTREEFYTYPYRSHL